MEVTKIYERKFYELVKNGVKNVLLENADNTDDLPEAESSPDRAPKNPNSASCFYCQVRFEDGSQEREHFKLDWHRYNLRRSLLSKDPITEEQFNDKTEKDEISSISGSDSDKEDGIDAAVTSQGKIFLQTAEGKIFSMYRCLLLSKKEELSEDLLSNRMQARCNYVYNKMWTVLLLGGGHFAAAVFEGDNPILHKTCHCYTVRAGQGGGQSSRDNKSGGSHPKSAGASMRRYNEQSLVHHVKNVIEAWKSEIAKSEVIVYRASGPYNRSVLFGGNDALLERNDSRLTAIPFSTRRATFAEVKRVHSILTTATFYDSLDSAMNTITRHKETEQNSKRTKLKTTRIDRAKSREIVDRPLTVELGNFKDSDSDDGSVDLISENVEINLEDSLQPFGDSLTQEERKRPHRKKKVKKSKTKKHNEMEERRKRDLVEVLCRGDVDKLVKLLDNQLKVGEIPEDEADNSLPDFVNEVLDGDGNTLLHVAAMNEQNETVIFLLERNANPCLKNKKSLTAYTSTQSKEIRDTLKQFARDNPAKYNYNKAQIPTNALNPEELVDKKKAQRKLKKEKEKIKKKENEIKRQEEIERERFLNLSDREKRALAAERRILNQSGQVTARCFLCGTDISGRVPFEYLGNRFCTVDCLKAHRLQNPVQLNQ